MIVDIMESVRLIESDPVGTVDRWLRVVGAAEDSILPRFGGRLVKSTGDGMLLELDSVDGALGAAFAINEAVAAANDGLPQDRHIGLRYGLAVGDLIVNRNDIYGHEVNLAARLAGLAGPGEVVGTAQVRDQITPGIEADVEDLGDCILKHVARPIRAYRFTRPGSSRIRLAPPSTMQLLPSLAVIPFRTLATDGEAAIGQVLAEELIRAFGQSPHVNVISRLSTAPFARRELALDEISELLGAHHVLTGTVAEAGGQLSVSLELTEVRSRQVIWADRIRTNFGEVFLGEQDFVARVAQAVGTAILNREMQRARSLPVRTLESYTLMLAAISAMYRLSKTDFFRAHEMLDAVIDRNPRHAMPRAWLGNWHVLKVQQGWSGERDEERQLAEGHTKRALDLDPDSPEALTIQGLVTTNLANEYDDAETYYRRAVELNPSSSLGWLLMGTMHSFRGDHAKAVDYATKGQSLSPFDPNTYYYDCLIGGCYVGAGRYGEALPHLERSLKLNAQHTSTLRVMTVAQWMTGSEEQAAATMQKMLALQPGLTVKKWQKSYALANSDFGKLAVDVFSKAGMPEE